jgi:hypothetical protein
MPPENLTPPQATAWANLRLRFVRSWDDFRALSAATENYALRLVTRKKQLPVDDFDINPTGSGLLYVVDERKTAVTPFRKLADELLFV